MNLCQRNECGNTFVLKQGSTGKYCSKSCAAKVNNVNRAKKRYCLNCDSQLTKHSQKKYCTQRCSQVYGADQYISRWIQGLENGSDNNGELRLTVRKHLILAADNRCTSSTCLVPGGWSVPNPVTGKVILTIDHIDGNWQNNKRDNLVVLCYNCHTLTPTFGALNKGKGFAPRSVGTRRH